MSVTRNTVIYWFRQDLRLADLPALVAAAGAGKVIPCFILDEQAAGEWAPGQASCWWLHHSLLSLEQSLAGLGAGLVVRRGATANVLAELADETGACAVYCSRAYEPWSRALEQTVATTLAATGRGLVCGEGSLLYQPDQVFNLSGTAFKVFTPYWKHCLRLPQPATCADRPAAEAFAGALPPGLKPADWGLLENCPDRRWNDYWLPGESGAARQLEQFTLHSLANYESGRDRPALDDTSRLSPHLHWGEISPRQVWHGIAMTGEASRDKFLSELGWREFSHYLLYHYPETTNRPFKSRFSNFPWLGQESLYQAWTQGRTGYPIVDAGMRELRETGFMHNRVRMICASFLTKHLLLPWQWGARWFWQELLDADLANNSCGWQWVAGCGADAAPYFRIFNPTLQGEKFDAEGEYVRRWVPQLAPLPDRYIHAPWKLSADQLSALGLVLGRDYPDPVVDHREARAAALDAWKLTEPGARQSLPDNGS